jgi:hypothetical protein
MYWAPERLDDTLRQPLARLRLPERKAPLWPDGAAVETRLAEGLGPRSNRLLYRS